MITCQEIFFRLAETNFTALCGYQNSDDEDKTFWDMTSCRRLVPEGLCLLYLYLNPWVNYLISKSPREVL